LKGVLFHPKKSRIPRKTDEQGGTTESFEVGTGWDWKKERRKNMTEAKKVQGGGSVYANIGEK